MYKIYISSPAGMSYTGVWTATEEEAERLCYLYNCQADTPYALYVYRKE